HAHTHTQRHTHALQQRHGEASYQSFRITTTIVNTAAAQNNKTCRPSREGKAAAHCTAPCIKSKETNKTISGRASGEERIAPHGWILRGASERTRCLPVASSGVERIDTHAHTHIHTHTRTNAPCLPLTPDLSL